MYDPNRRSTSNTLNLIKIESLLYYALNLCLCNLICNLITRKADVNAQDELHKNSMSAAACHSANKAVIKLLLDAEADVNVREGLQNKTPLQTAAVYTQNEAVIQLLLDAEADVNAQGEYFENALQAAAACSKKEAIVQLLLDVKADVNA